MRSFVQDRTTLGTDDQDAIRWIYGDGGNSCNGGALTITALTPSPAPPQPVGTRITWTATTTGGVPPIQYEFWRYSASTGWMIVQGYSTTNTFSWMPSQPGQYDIAVWVKNAGSPNNNDGSRDTGYFIITP
jgi:hypothetical protein